MIRIGTGRAVLSTKASPWKQGSLGGEYTGNAGGHNSGPTRILPSKAVPTRVMGYGYGYT